MSAFERVERREVITTTMAWRKGEPDKVESRTVVTTWYTVTGVEAVPLYGERDRGNGRLYEPVAVVIVCTGRAPDVRVDGRLRRKDGTLSEGLQQIHGLSRWGIERPAWLTEIVLDAGK